MLLVSVFLPDTPSSWPPTQVSSTSTRPLRRPRPGWAMARRILRIPGPGRLAAARAEEALKVQGASTELLIRHEPHGPKSTIATACACPRRLFPQSQTYAAGMPRTEVDLGPLSRPCARCRQSTESHPAIAGVAASRCRPPRTRTNRRRQRCDNLIGAVTSPCGHGLSPKGYRSITASRPCRQ